MRALLLLALVGCGDDSAARKDAHVTEACVAPYNDDSRNTCERACDADLAGEVQVVGADALACSSCRDRGLAVFDYMGIDGCCPEYDAPLGSGVIRHFDFEECQ